MRSKIVLNIHAEEFSSFEPRVLLGAAAGSVVVTESISLPAWLNEHSFIFVDTNGDEWLDKIEMILGDYKKFSDAASNFRSKIQKLTAASLLIESKLELIEKNKETVFKVFRPKT